MDPQGSHGPERRHVGWLPREHSDVMLAIALGGALGSAARWALGVGLPHSAGHFAWSTWTANVLGACLIGVLMAVLEQGIASRLVRPFLGVGVLGGFTTFSTYMLDAHEMLTRGHAVTAAAYTLSTLLAGMLAVFAGLVLSRLALSIRRTHPGRSPSPPPDDRSTR